MISTAITDKERYLDSGRIQSSGGAGRLPDGARLAKVPSIYGPTADEPRF